MKKHSILFIFLMCLLSCKDDEPERLGYTNYLSLSATFYDAKTGKKINDFIETKYGVKSISGFPLPDYITDSVTGAKVTLGPLDDEKYLIEAKAKYGDVEYFGLDTIDMSNEEITAYSHAIELLPKESSAILNLNIYYRDLLTDDIIRNQENIVTRLTRLNGLEFSGSSFLEKNGGEVQFNNLNQGESYIVESSYDSENIIYGYMDTIQVLNTAVSNYEIELVPNNSSKVLTLSTSVKSAFTGGVIDNATVKAELTKINGDLFSNGSRILSKEGTILTFHELQSEVDYMIKAQYTDESTDALYLYKDTVTFEKNDLKKFMEIELEPSTSQTFVFGEISSVSPITAGEVSLESIDFEGEYQNAFIDFNLHDRNNDTRKFLIGPLVKDQEANLTFQANDDLGLIYVDTLLVAGDEDFLDERHVQLEWLPSTTTYILVVDSNGDPLANAEVFVYTNYTNLIRYPYSLEASLMVQSTNSKGQLIIQGLEPRQYFFLGRKTVENDVWSSLPEEGFDPSSVPELVENDITDITLVLDSLVSQ